MADPQRTIDPFEASTVRMYRASIASAAGALLVAAGAYIAGGLWGRTPIDVPTLWMRLVWTLLVYATAGAVINQHFEDRAHRWRIRAVAWGGAIALVGAYAITGQIGSFLLERVALALLFAAWSMMAIEEEHSFHFPLMRLVPWFLGAAIVTMLANLWLPSGLLLLCGGGLLGLLASKKQFQPLGHDIADRPESQGS